MVEIPRHPDPFVDLLDELIRLNGRIKSLFSAVDARGGFSAMESTVLTAVVEAGARPTVPQIGRSIGHARQVVQRAANTLVASGLIELLPNPEHKRAPLLSATRKGIIEKRRSDVRASRATAMLASAFSPEKCRRLTGELHELRTEMEQYIRAANAPR